MNLASATNTSDNRSSESSSHNIFYKYIHFPECKRLINRMVTAQKENGIKTVTVLSHFPGEGKTNLISVLALGYRVLLDKRVLIIDSISPTREDSFYIRSNLENPGSEFRQGCVDLITIKTLTHKTALHYSTEPSAQALALWQDRQGCESADFQVSAFVNSVKDSYDLILIDTCALSQVSENDLDPIILAQHTDSSIIVATTPSLEREILSDLMTQLKRHRIKPLGIVANLGITS